MDPVTHAISGLVFGKLTTKNKVLIVIVLIFSFLPDIDILLIIHSKELFLMHHRGITHGILALMVFPLIPAFILRKKTGLLKTYIIAFLAYFLHILFDLTNQYGTKILSPLDWTSYRLSLTFIIDPYVIFPFLIAFILSLKFKSHSRILLVLSFAFIAIYISVKAYLKNEARNFLKHKIEAHQYRVYPLPNDFLRWWFVTKYSNEYIVGFVDLFTEKICIDSRYKMKDDEIIRKSKEAKSVKTLLNFAQFPVAEVKQEGNAILVVWRELSYSFLPNDRFTTKVWLKETSKGYEIINEKLKI